MPIKIMHIIDSLDVGGLESNVVNLVNRMDYCLFDHSICCIRAIGPMAERIIRKDVRIICMYKKDHERDYLMPVKLVKAIRKVKPDIIHTRSWGTIDGVFAAIIMNVKSIIHSEEGRRSFDIEGINRKRNMIRRLIKSRIFKYIVISNGMEDWLVNIVGIPKKKVCTIVNGVDTKKFQPAYDKAAIRRELGFDESIPIIGVVSRLSKIKNYKLLLEALFKMKQFLPPYKLIIVGDGPERDELERYTKLRKLENVLFVGEKSNVPIYYQSFDLFVVTSLWEGLSNSILEAMASGVAVLATNVGGNSEIVSQDFNGRLVPSGDVNALSNDIMFFLNNPDICEKFGKAGRLLCESKYSLEKMVFKYQKLYSSI